MDGKKLGGKLEGGSLIEMRMHAITEAETVHGVECICSLTVVMKLGPKHRHSYSGQNTN